MRQLEKLVLGLSVAACGAHPPDATSDTGGIASATAATTSGGSSSTPAPDSSSGSGAGAPESSSGDEASTGPLFDVGGGDHDASCSVPGQIDCDGPRVLECQQVGGSTQWAEIDFCEKHAGRVKPRDDEGGGYAGETCDVVTGTCATSTVIGSNTPTGRYYQYARFTQDLPQYHGGADVDSWVAGPMPDDDNRIVVLRRGMTGDTVVDIYTVELLDSDGDGMLEPDQHPDNPDATGPIEERVLTHLETVSAAGLPAGVSNTELYVTSADLEPPSSQISKINPPSADNGFLSIFAHQSYSHFGYNELEGVWYAGSEFPRRIYEYSDVADDWGIAFDYPDLAGDHADGMEVVVDGRTDTAYVYVSDMTSDFIAQYRWDPDAGWNQENLFEYDGTGEFVEGMGFGAFNHFWATSGSVLYEIGGGDLQAFVDDPIPPQG